MATPMLPLTQPVTMNTFWPSKPERPDKFKYVRRTKQDFYNSLFPNPRSPQTRCPEHRSLLSSATPAMNRTLKSLSQTGALWKSQTDLLKVKLPSIIQAQKHQECEIDNQMQVKEVFRE